MAKASILFLRLLMILIFSGWASLWTLKPTEIWTRKWKDVEDKANKTLLNYNGLDFAVYTLPFLALAMVGFIYLEVRSKIDQKRPEKKLMNDLHNPLVIRRNIGVLTGFEILFISIFVAFLSWTFYAHISKDFKKMDPIKGLKLNMWQYKVFKIATRTGLLTEACLALLLLPILRGMAIFRIAGIQFEVSVRYHIWLGTTMVFFGTLHGAGTFFIWGIKHCVQDKMWKWQPTGRIYLAGEIALLALLAIWITSLPQIRRRHFETFYYTHHLYIVFFIFFLFHTGDRHFYMVFPGIFLFALDKVLRVIQSWPETCILAARVFPCKAVELTIPKDPSKKISKAQILGIFISRTLKKYADHFPFTISELTYAPTSVIFLKIPHISKFQWHSFSITSSSSVDNHTISVIIKSEGWWTNALYNLVLAKPDDESHQMKCLPISVEGPYGPKSIEFLRYDSLILVAGGIGITPFIGILKEFASSPRNAKYMSSKGILLVYTVKSSQDISLLSPIMAQLQDVQKNILKVNVFVTREAESGGRTLKDVLDHELSKIQTITFDTGCSRSAAGGVENLPWMAAMIGISSVIFLVVLCCFNHSIYPPGKKMAGKKVLSSLVDLLLLCSFTTAIICISSLAIVLRWKKATKELPPFSGLLKEKTRSSSAQTDSTAMDHEIHFGRRPDFQELFHKFAHETGGSNIGVFVCGPEAMKESVALTCKPNSQAFRGGNQKRKPSVSFHSLNFTL